MFCAGCRHLNGCSVSKMVVGCRHLHRPAWLGGSTTENNSSNFRDVLNLQSEPVRLLRCSLSTQNSLGDGRKQEAPGARPGAWVIRREQPRRSSRLPRAARGRPSWPGSSIPGASIPRSSGRSPGVHGGGGRARRRPWVPPRTGEHPYPRQPLRLYVSWPRRPRSRACRPGRVHPRPLPG